MLIINILPACTQSDPVDELTILQTMDSIAGVKIDSAYKKVKAECDTAQKYRLPILVDSFLHADTVR